MNGTENLLMKKATAGLSAAWRRDAVVKKSIREAYGKALAELGRERSRLVVLDADVSSSTRSVIFGREFPERFFNVGIAESNMVAVAAGMAACGLVPFVNTFAFLLAQRAADVVSNLIAQNCLNVKLAGAYCGLSASYDGASHQSVNDIAVMRSLPNMTVITVADAVEARLAARAAAGHKGPVYIRLSRAELPVIFDGSYSFKIGRGNLLVRGSDVTIIASGYMVYKALVASDMLKNGGLSAEVINIHTVKPLDGELVAASAKKTGTVVVVEEHSVIGGLGSAVCELLSRRCPVPVRVLGLKDTFAESGDYESLLEKYGMDSPDIFKTAFEAVSDKRL